MNISTSSLGSASAGSSSAEPAPHAEAGLSVVIGSVLGCLGGWYLRGLISQALMFLLHRRLGMIRVQMERLGARFRAGRLRPPVARGVPKDVVAAACGAAPGVAPGVARRTPGVSRIWPGRFGWLVWLGSWPAAGYGCQLRAVLETPEMVALLTAAPQAVRILRPLCRALAVETSILRPGVVREVVAVVQGDSPSPPPKPAKKRVRKKVDWGRIPLPRGVLSAARRAGFYKGG